MGPMWGLGRVHTVWVPVLVVMATTLQVIHSLQMTVEPQDQIALLHNPIFMDCVAEGLEPITYSWRRNNILLPLSDNQIIYNNGTLHIRRLTYDDVGVYMCTATSGGQTVSSRQTTLEMAYIDTTFETNPVSASLQLGDRLVQSCSIESQPHAEITWTLDSAPVTRGMVEVNDDGESTLTLYPVLYEDKGLYKCKATNPMIPGVIRYSFEANIVIKGQPVFLTTLQSVMAPLRYPATFLCRFYGNPGPTVRWLKHDKNSEGDVTSSELVDSDKYSVFNNGTLIIHNVVNEDSITYTCTVENDYGQISESAQLYVSGMPTLPYFTTLPSNISVVEGSSALFLCQCSGLPEPQVVWTKSGSRLISSEKVSTSTNGSLIIYKTQSTDMDWYTCLCENPEGIVNQSVFLDVLVGPTIINPPTDTFALEGEAMTLTCVARGNPAPYITWITPQHGQLLSSIEGYIISPDGSLTIAMVTATDSGIYTCTASNVIRTVSASTRIKVEAPPQMRLLPSSQSIIQGGRAYFHCQATGIPMPSYVWIKDGEGQIISSENRQIYLNNTLAIHKVTLQDAGTYHCRAINDHGQISSVATLTVTVTPYFSISPSNMTVQEGSTVKMYCVAQGNPVPVQYWQKQGRFITDDNIQILPDGSQLTIVGVRRAQYGQYTCVASNMAGISSVSAWVSALDVPVLILGPKNIVVNQSDTLTLQCEGDAIEAPSVRWYKQQQGQLTLLSNNLRTVVQNGQLTIKGVLYSDEGFYKCVIANTAGEISATAFVDVQVPATIISTNSPQSAVSQSVVTLSCQSTGDPAPSLSWANPNGQVISSSPAYQVRDHTLQILLPNRNTDVGEWTCTACNSIGCDTEKVELILEGEPEIKSFYGNQNTVGFVTLTCEASSIPDPMVTLMSEGQQVQGPSRFKVTAVISQNQVKPTFTCEAKNIHGVATKTVTVPSQPPAPSVVNIEPGTMTLSWFPPSNMGSLPLIGIQVQQTSDLGQSWQNAKTDTLSQADILSSRQINVTELLPFMKYAFRVAAINILGSGPFGASSRFVKTLSGEPSAPTNLVALEIREDIVLVTWEHPTILNGPKSQIEYDYMVTIGETSPVIHSQGTIPANQSLHVEITDLTTPGMYTFSLWARNTALNIDGEPAFLKIDRTSPIKDHYNTTSTEDKNVQPDKLIIILFGVIGGIILIVVIIFIIVHVRHHRKSETHSFVRPRYSLDQFYMENPKDLYEKADKGHKSMRRRSQGFYKFDNDESFNSVSQSLKDQRNSIIESTENVLLVAKNPLYDEDGVSRRSFPRHSPKGSFTDQISNKQLSIQHEIEAPNSNTSQIEPLMSSHSGSEVIDDVINDTTSGNNGKSPDALTPLSAKDLEDDLQRIYGDTAARIEYETETGLENIYSSFHGNNERSRSQSEESLKSSGSHGSTTNTCGQKPPIRVVNHSQLRAKKPETLVLTYTQNGSVGKEKSLSGCIPMQKSSNGVNSLESTSLNRQPEQVAHVKPYSVNGEMNIKDVLSVNQNGTNTSENDSELPNEIESANTSDCESDDFDSESSGADKLTTDLSDTEQCNMHKVPAPEDAKILDDFLNEEEIKKEVISAALY